MVFRHVLLRNLLLWRRVGRGYCCWRGPVQEQRVARPLAEMNLAALADAPALRESAKAALDKASETEKAKVKLTKALEDARFAARVSADKAASCALQVSEPQSLSV